MFQGMEYVYAVYKAKSFSKAAKELFISQPSLSASIKRIEKKMGYPIFDRSTKPLQLTEYGEAYIRAVEQMMMIKNEFSNYINDLGELKAGCLYLACRESCRCNFRCRKRTDIFMANLRQVMISE